MRQLRYMLRLHHDGVSAREIGRTLGVARSTIQDNLRRAQASGIGWSNRNAHHTKANWHFTTHNARIKLSHLYPSI
jgi:IS30 family transposase